ncbi:MAG TPA: asparagine synthase (glutamine-hydrolyzing) [Bryobacteraceae bacterium]|nr:asparagine synthase (glutamine-hydrolyzing) [Bryobacteraceae bacterium]
MCGIAGVFSYGGQMRVDSEILTRMRDTMSHRGPDGGDNWLSADGRVGLAHRRLSIIDLSNAASQPMTNQDESVWVTFNGEIYNHLKLRQELVAAGYKFRTDHSDTEVLVHGYVAWGIDGLMARIEGDYAIALWDTRLEKLFLFRDRIGVKPLYFSLQQGAILFASEIKAILQHPAVPRDVDPVAMYHYLSFLTTPAPFTMFKGIFKLPAGYCLEIEKNGKFTANRYWDALPGKAIDKARLATMDWPEREKFYVEGIRDRLDAAVEKRMMSDVPFGVFLSGGIDSSTNVALMSRYMDRPVDTFTVGFKDHQHLNELEEANLVAREFKTNHHQILIDEDDMRGYLGDLIHHQDEPIADWVCIPLYFVSKLAKDSGVTVVQVGEGSDEQFCGYASYMGYLDLYRKYWQPFRKFVPSPLQRAAAGLAGMVADRRPSLGMYADIIDRASRNREHFWSGATVFPESVKSKLVRSDNIGTTDVPAELIESGLMPASYLQTDTFNIIQSFNQQIEKADPGHDILARMTYNEFKLRLPELLLMRVDKIGMSVSLEARVPFLDHDLVDFSMDIPMQDKVHGGVAKYLLKKAVEGIIPNEIIYRKKMGFGAPMSEWMRGDFGRQVQSSMMASRIFERGFFDRPYIDNLFEEHRNGRNDYSLYLWTLFNLTAWYDYWIEGQKV